MKLERLTVGTLLEMAKGGSESVEVPAETLAELCKAWLALDAAPVVSVEKRGATFGHGDYGYQWVIGDSYNPPPLVAQGMYVQYRLVPSPTHSAGGE